jgi:hypothetical protein
MSEWQPIETAPKDGTSVLVMFRGLMFVAEFVPIWHPDNKQWAVRLPPTQQNLRETTVTQISPPMNGGKPYPGMWEGPTHWMPPRGMQTAMAL